MRVAPSRANQFAIARPIPEPAPVTMMTMIVVAAVVVAVVFVLGMLLLGIYQAALSGIYSAALYRYAVAHETPEAFQGVQLQDAFQPKR